MSGGGARKKPDGDRRMLQKLMKAKQRTAAPVKLRNRESRGRRRDRRSEGRMERDPGPIYKQDG